MERAMKARLAVALYKHRREELQLLAKLLAEFATPEWYPHEVGGR
jgi:hypothetical protein